jgi:hypothetical protein
MAVGRCLAAESSASPMLQQAYDQLLSVKAFALWEIGIAGAMSQEEQCIRFTSQGEQCFRTLVVSTNGLPLFKAALTNGTTAARLYALCGIRLLAPDQFDSLAAPLTRTNSRVFVMVGSIGNSMGTSNIVAQIRRGSFDDLFPPHQQSP